MATLPGDDCFSFTRNYVNLENDLEVPLLDFF